MAEAGVLLCGVTQTKEKGDVRYVGVDAPYEPAIVGDFWAFVTGATAVGCVAFAGLPAAF